MRRCHTVAARGLVLMALVILTGCGAAGTPKNRTVRTMPLAPTRLVLANETPGAGTSGTPMMLPVRPMSYVLDRPLVDLGTSALVRGLVPHRVTATDSRRFAHAHLTSPELPNRCRMVTRCGIPPAISHSFKRRERRWSRLRAACSQSAGAAGLPGSPGLSFMESCHLRARTRRPRLLPRRQLVQQMFPTCRTHKCSRVICWIAWACWAANNGRRESLMRAVWPTPVLLARCAFRPQRK